MAQLSGKAEGRRPHPVSGWRTAALCYCRGTPQHHRFCDVGRDLCVPPPAYGMPPYIGFVHQTHAPCRGRCPHRPAHRTIVQPLPCGIGLHTAPPYTVLCRGVRSPVRIRPGTLDNDTRYRWDDVGIVPYKHGRTTPRGLWVGTSSNTVRHKAAVHHPRWGGDGGLRLRRGLRHLRMALWTLGVLRPLRRAGVSLAAASGNFARCDGRPGLCPWTPRFFEKNRVKLLSFYSRIVTCIWFAASCQGTLCPAPWLQKMESAGFSVSRSRSYPEAAATASPSGQTS